jgi:hypothetical protein
LDNTEWESWAVQKWLGWDPYLWSSYQQTVDILAQVAFVDFPREPSGTYAWLIPRKEEENSGILCRIPKSSIPIDVVMIALLFNLSTLPLNRTYTWYHRTNPTKDVALILDRFISVAAKKS